MSDKTFDKEDIFFVVKSYNNGRISKNQMSEFLMYVYENGFTDQQTFNLTCAMMSKGKKLDLSNISLSVDKHSTGGVSDSTTLIVVPLFALLGFQCFKMSGGALGHTGGTADKMRVFENINIQLSTHKAINITKKHGGCFVCQTKDIAPIDKKIYALRDEIGAVNSIPLIASSIMSKKLAVGSQNIVLDVKFGSGALIKNKNQAQQLASFMCNIGNFYGKDVRYILGDMSQPLGNAIGDYYEVMEVLYLLNNYKKCRLIEHSVNIVCQFADKINLSYDDCFNKCINLIKDGSVYNKLISIIKAQNGQIPQIENIENIEGYIFKAKQQGVLKTIKTDKLGELLHKYKKGAYMLAKTGDKLKNNQPIIKIFSDVNQEFLQQLNDIFIIE